MRDKERTSLFIFFLEEIWDSDSEQNALYKETTTDMFGKPCHIPSVIKKKGASAMSSFKGVATNTTSF